MKNGDFPYFFWSVYQRVLYRTAVVRTGCPICLEPATHLFQAEQLGSLCGGVQGNNQQVERSVESGKCAPKLINVF